MKRYSLFIVFVHIVCFACLPEGKAKAQTYYPLVDTNKVWNNLILWADGVSSNNYTVKFTSDTVINSLHYKKVLQIGFDEAPVKYIREDSTEKVFYKYYPDSAEALLYDFNIGLNDTFTINTIPAYPVKLIADTIDSVKISGKLRKRIYLSWVQTGAVNDTWIEGIGSLRGVLTTFNLGLSNSQNDVLLCFTENDTLKYINPEFSTCSYSGVGIQGYNANNNAVEIFPNPVTDNLQTQTGTGSEVRIEKSEIRIYDIIGNLVLEKSITENKTNIDISALPDGVYIVHVKSEEVNNVGKFVKE